jgi:hypothetical protein
VRRKGDTDAWRDEERLGNNNEFKRCGWPCCNLSRRRGKETEDKDEDKNGKTAIAHVRFDVFTAMAMKNGVLWDVTPCGPYKNRRFGGT